MTTTHDVGSRVRDLRHAGVQASPAPLVALFILVVSLPLLANLVGVDGGDPGAENRELAAFHGANLGEWFNDHFGFRSTLVRWYGEGRLFGLGVSPTTTVLSGRDGWFFYADDKAVEDFASDDPLTPDAIANWRDTIVRAQRWLRPKGIGYLFAVAPDKHAIYPEEFPPSLERVGAMSRTDQLYGSLADTGALVDLRPALFQAKARERIYQKTDTHWNDRGALVAYQALITAARAQVPSIPAASTRADFDDVDREVEAMDLAGMMGLKRVLRETDLTLVPKRPRRARVVEPAGGEPTDEEGRIVTEIPGSALPRAVIFRDSFVSRLVPFVSEHFSRAVYLWQNDFDAEVVTKEHPDIVIQEIVGRHLYNFIPSPELVPDR
jgi:alginate O-acetyltransferase complex protein AlgJ